MADPNSSLSPEKKLLDIIEGSGAGKEANPGEPADARRPEGPDFQALLTPALWSSLLTGLVANLTALFKTQQSGMTLKRVIAVCRGATIILGVILGLNLIYEFYVTNMPLKKKTGVAMQTVAEASETMNPVYSSTIASNPAQRNVFAPIARKQESTDGRGNMALQLLEMTKQMKLTGISIHPEDANRTFCMIEDLQKNITAFLKIGDTISGMAVSKITPESVTLKYENEEIEIR